MSPPAEEVEGGERRPPVGRLVDGGGEGAGLGGRVTASKSVSTPGASRVMAVGQVAGELVMTTSPEARSYQALWRMPWWPG